MTSEAESVGWPESMRYPEPQDFVKLFWSDIDGDGGRRTNYEDPGDLPCGTRFCLVGMVRNSFGLPATPVAKCERTPNEHVETPLEANEFMVKVCDLLGGDGLDPKDADTWVVVSDYFETTFFDDDFVKVCEAYREALAFFGFTERRGDRVFRKEVGK